jgi:C4-dicarboxylate transporter DctQ subunit
VKKSASLIGKVAHSLYQHTEGFLMAMFTLMLVTDVLLGILARYVHFEVVFATELGKYLFIWLCAIGISAAAKDHQHVRLNFFAEKLPVSRRASWVISQGLFLLFTLFFFYWGLRLTLMHLEMNKSVMGFHFPMFIFTAALPVGFALTSFRLVVDIIHCLRKTDPAQPWVMEPPEELRALPEE